MNENDTNGNETEREETILNEEELVEEDVFDFNSSSEEEEAEYQKITEYLAKEEQLDQELTEWERMVNEANAKERITAKEFEEIEKKKAIVTALRTEIEQLQKELGIIASDTDSETESESEVLENEAEEQPNTDKGKEVERIDISESLALLLKPKNEVSASSKLAEKNYSEILQKKWKVLRDEEQRKYQQKKRELGGFGLWRSKNLFKELNPETFVFDSYSFGLYSHFQAKKGIKSEAEITELVVQSTIEELAGEFSKSQTQELISIKNVLKDVKERYDDEVLAVQKEREQKDERIETLEAGIDTIKKEGKSQLEQKEKEYQSQYLTEEAKWEEQLTNTKNDLNQTKKDKEKLEQEKEILLTQIQTLSEEKANLILNYNQIAAKKHQLEQAAAEVAERINAQTLLPDPKDLDLKKWQKKCQELANTNELQRGVIAAKTIMTNERNQQIENLNNVLTQLQTQKEIMEEQLRAIQTELANTRIDLESAKTDLEHKNQKITTLETWRKQREEKITKLEQENLGLKSDKGLLQADIKAKGTQLEDNAKSFMIERSRKEEARAENLTLKLAAEDDKSTINQLTTERDNLKSEVTTLTAETVRLNKELTKAIQQKRIGMIANVAQGAIDYIPVPDKWKELGKTSIQVVSGWALFRDLPNWTYEGLWMVLGIGIYFALLKLGRRIFGRKEINKFKELQGKLQASQTELLLTQSKLREAKEAKNEEKKLTSTPDKSETKSIDQTEEKSPVIKKTRKRKK